MIVENRGKNKIMIVTNWKPSITGGAAEIERTISLLPTQQLDLASIGLYPVNMDPCKHPNDKVKVFSLLHGDRPTFEGICECGAIVNPVIWREKRNDLR